MTEADWLGYEDAHDRVLASVRPLEVERVPLPAALGRALAVDVAARVAHPPWDNSAMDGFAVRAADVAGARPDAPVRLPISDDIPAGRFPSGPLRVGTAARVMTGAPVPDGATGVIRVEHTDGGRGESVRIFDVGDAERHIRRRGEDVEVDDVLVAAGEEIVPAALALIGMAGLAEVPVGRRPRVGVLANGDELADLDRWDEVRAGRRIFNSNGLALAAQVTAAGGEPVSLGIARDDPDDLRSRLGDASGLDAWVSAAGVSVGEHDHVKQVLDELGFERDFWRVRMRPGSATLFARGAGRPFWGVPGNPVSALVTFETLVRPALRKMAGFSRYERRPIRCRVAEDVAAPPDVTAFLRVVLTDGPRGGPPVVRLTGFQGSGMMTSMLCDGLLVVPEGTRAVEAGGWAEVLPLREWSCGQMRRTSAPMV